MLNLSESPEDKSISIPLDMIKSNVFNSSGIGILFLFMYVRENKNAPIIINFNIFTKIYPVFYFGFLKKVSLSSDLPSFDTNGARYGTPKDSIEQK